MTQSRKDLGAFYTPHEVVRFLVDWAVEGEEGTRVLDPSCGDGRFIEAIPGAVGIDIDPEAARIASERCPHQEIVLGDFFEWAASTPKLFDAIVGNPPFIRYHRFHGNQRLRALRYCAAHGVQLSASSSSWAFFVVGASARLEIGGRLAFVVPAEIAHAVYARPVLRYLLDNFAKVELFAVQQKLFPHIAEDCWLLRAAGYGSSASELDLYTAPQFVADEDRWHFRRISRTDLEYFDFRLRPFILPSDILELYRTRAQGKETVRFGDIASIGIGYVTGANDFFHLRPSQAKARGIGPDFLRPAVRSGRDLKYFDIDEDVIRTWVEEDRPFLLLDLNRAGRLPKAVLQFLNSDAGHRARMAYKCRNRSPWYCVPGVKVPDAFLSVMATGAPQLVGNSSRSVCANSVHAVFVKKGVDLVELLHAWRRPLTELSCEIEGHNLGGGMLKLEPTEARNVLIEFPKHKDMAAEDRLIMEGVEYMRMWRGNGKAKARRLKDALNEALAE